MLLVCEEYFRGKDNNNKQANTNIHYSEVVTSRGSIAPWPGRPGLQRISEDGRSAETVFTRLKVFPDNTSLVLCIIVYIILA